MLTIEEHEEQTIKTLIENGKRDDLFGASHVQRVCRVGYNLAQNSIDRAVTQGVLVRDDEKQWLVRFAL